MELKKQCEREILRRYITDGIQMITQNTARRDERLYLSIGYEDIISPKPVENRSAEDIVADVMKNAGLKLVTKGGGQDGG
jgi:hypothetical protein